MSEQDKLQQIKKRLTDILLHYTIYMDGAGISGDHNHMADSLTFEVEKMLQEENAQLRELVHEYRRLVNTYHECYPYPEDLAPIRDELGERAKPFLGSK